MKREKKPTLRKQVAELKEALEAATTGKKAAEDQVISIGRRFDAAESKVVDLTVENTDLITKVTELREDGINLTRENEELNRDNKGLNGALVEAGRKIDNLRTISGIFVAILAATNPATEIVRKFNVYSTKLALSLDILEETQKAFHRGFKLDIDRIGDTARKASSAAAQEMLPRLIIRKAGPGNGQPEEFIRNIMALATEFGFSVEAVPRLPQK